MTDTCKNLQHAIDSVYEEAAFVAFTDARELIDISKRMKNRKDGESVLAIADRWVEFQSKLRLLDRIQSGRDQDRCMFCDDGEGD